MDGFAGGGHGPGNAVPDPYDNVFAFDPERLATEDGGDLRSMTKTVPRSVPTSSRMMRRMIAVNSAKSRVELSSFAASRIRCRRSILRFAPGDFGQVGVISQSQRPSIRPQSTA